MIETEILTADDKVELLEKYVVLKMPRNPAHDGTLQQTMELLFPLRPRGWSLRILMAIALADSQPEPDIAFVRGVASDYLKRHPGPTDIGSLIEIADASLIRDQRDKTRIYARAAIPFYWIVNLVDRRVEVYSQPSGPTAQPAYGSFQIYQPGDSVPIVLDGVQAGTVGVADLIP